MATYPATYPIKVNDTNSTFVASRKVNETIVIGEGIKVTVLSFKGERVRVSVNLPRDVTVDRGEVREMKQSAMERIKAVHLGGVDEQGND